MNNFNFGGLDASDTEYEHARYVVMPVPYDLGSTWRQGADKGPNALLEASANMELFDIETRTEPYLAGIHTTEPVMCQDTPDVLYKAVLQQARQHVQAGKFLITLGGNHSVPIGSCQAACEHFPRDQVSILQIDAHSDLRESYQGNAYNHACAMARMKAWGNPVGVGIRSMDSSELEAVEKANLFLASDIQRNPDWIADVLSCLKPNVYLTIDLDGLDPSIMPATGTPEPGGLGWYQVLDLIEAVIKRRHLLGYDVVELCPQPGFFHANFLAAKLVYKIMAAHYAKETNNPQ